MSFNTFREWLETEYVSPVTSRPLGHDAPSDYASRLRTLSRLLDMDIENAASAQLDDLASTFEGDPRIASTQTGKAIIDMRVALRRYALYLRQYGNGTVPPPTPGAKRADELADLLRQRGFAIIGARRHTFELQRGGCIVYLKRLSDTLPIVVAPEYEADYSRIAGFDGVAGSRPFGYYHNSQMPAFPKRTNRGRSAIHYGLDFDVSDADALDRLIFGLTRSSHLVPSAPERAEQNTETVRLQKARLGQGQFRADLFDIWGTCPLSGVATPDLLRASHIKPWRSSSRSERLDPHNGILLAVHLDCLFDKGFISVTDKGEVLVSDKLSAAERQVFGLTAAPPRIRVQDKHLPYLRHHREEVYLDSAAA